jgi:hypothetical protein
VKANIFIPKKINVGFQNRNDTYTGKLAYIIYTDEKGKLRKETSWQSWRDEKIPPQEFDNIPTEGFVLNKKVGDYDSGWSHRHAYTRVYDPRNFEFEITIENLLYILENATSTKGKGLEGQFIYGWDGKDLLLMPIESPDYKEINEYNNILHNNETIKAKDLIIGATYLTKDNHEMVYMGKYDYYSSGYMWLTNKEWKTSKSHKDIPDELVRYGRRKIDYKNINNFHYGKYLWFAYKNFDYDYVNGERVNKTEYKWNFNQYPSISGKFIKCIDDKCLNEYADIFEKMECSYNYSPYDESKDVFCKISLEDFIKHGKCEYNDGSIYYSSFKFISESTGIKKSYLVEPVTKDKNDYILQEYKYKEDDKYTYGYKVGFVKVQNISSISLEEIYEKVQPLYIQRYLKNGRKYEKEYSL